ncbi:hypothetical protein SAMD00019534_116950, partial [Acytostelium subglobosum LB1]|uniref:hypothetical protein n=1 Tax=Acytostelium subglobosum LB1 TaxID=1410327 RepID=UPI000644A215
RVISTTTRTLLTQSSTLTLRYMPQAGYSSLTDPDAPLTDVEKMRKRLLWQSKERGMLENDLLLGTFATKNIATLTEQQLRDYDILIQQPDPDIYNWALSKEDVPDELNTDVMKLLQHHCTNNPMGYPTKNR